MEQLTTPHTDETETIMSASILLDVTAEPLELDLTMDDLMDQLDPGWVAWAARGTTAATASAGRSESGNLR